PHIFYTSLTFDTTFCPSPSCHSRDLHSFPTRRSSDLLRFPEGRRHQFQLPPLRPGLVRSGLLPRPRLPPPDSAARERQPRWPAADRKSTRLNSSHQIISYAVFCLKKKNKTQQPTLQLR